MMQVCGRAQPLSRSVVRGQSGGGSGHVQRRQLQRNGSLPRDTLPRTCQGRPGFRTIFLTRKLNLDKVKILRRAELDFFDYRQLNGAYIENGASPPELVEVETVSEYEELDEDVEELEKEPEPKTGPWKRISNIRAFMDRIKNDEEFGTRGEGLVVVTLAIALAAIFPPFNAPGCIVAGGYIAIVYGFFSAVAGLVALGASFSPLPVPKEEAAFVTRGIFRFVRHPFYSGLFLIIAGLTAVSGNEFRLMMTGVLYWLLEQTIKGEERDLESAFPEYATYKTKVAKLIPYVY